MRRAYQLARNAMAVTVREDGTLDASAGHVTVVYDARNPSMREGGEATRQWADAMAACRVPGLLRRISWQNVSAALCASPDLHWLVEGLAAKYGIEPR
jgi:hypothetical protein